MNIELLQQVRDHLRSEPDTFDMTRWFEVTVTPTGWCHTAACIAGTALLLGDPDLVNLTVDTLTEGFAAGEDVWWTDNVEGLAAELLELDEDTAALLFTPWAHCDIDPADLSASRAARVIDHLINTGEVRW